MNHILLIFACILSIEVFFRFNFSTYLSSLLSVIRKTIYLISSKRVSDHWKEIMIPIYAFDVMKLSLLILITLIFISFIFLVIGFLFNSFLDFTISVQGIIESILFIFIYSHFRKVILSE